MFEPFNIVYFTPFYFPNGKSAPKNKYYIPILSHGSNAVYAYLPTSKDSIPDQYFKHGCINIHDKNISCYLFGKDKVITTNNFSFPLNTFVYLYQMNTFDKSVMSNIYTKENVDYEIIGKLRQQEIDNIVSCIVSSKFVSRKVKRLLQ